MYSLKLELRKLSILLRAFSRLFSQLFFEFRTKTFFPVIFLIGASCNLADGGGDDKKESSSQTEQNSGEDFESSPEVGTLAVGGVPSLDEVAELSSLSATEAEVGLSGISAAQGSLSIDLSADGASLQLSQEAEGECEGSFFCFAKAFTDIYDMITGAAQCNFDLMLAAGESPKQIGDYPVHYLDGWGTVALGDGGLQPCPAYSEVETFISRVNAGTHSDDDTFFLPMRLVLFKKADGLVHWRMVFFPADHIGAVAARIPFFEGLRNESLDFFGFTGSHDITAEVGKGNGRVLIDFDELGRMFAMLDSLGGGSLRLNQQEGFPRGKIDITYDLTSDPQDMITVFRDDFSFGDSNDNFFVDGEPTRILRSGGENYLGFMTAQSFSDDQEGETSPFQAVQLCRTHPELFKYQKDVSAADYLATPSKTYVQMIWSDLTSGETHPSRYLSRVIQTQGGANIYGPTFFEGASSGGSELETIRIKTPLCADLQAEMDASNFAFVGFVPLSSDGYVNASLGGSSGPAWKTSFETLSSYPVFDQFKFVDPENSDDSPVGKAEAVNASNYPVPRNGYCSLPSGACSSFEGLEITSLGFMYSFCVGDPNSGSEGPSGLGGTWSLDSACEQTSAHVCEATDFTFGGFSGAIESVKTYYYESSQVASSDVCSFASGVLTPPVAGSCSLSSLGTCIEAESIQMYQHFSANCASQMSGSWDGSSACTALNLSATCVSADGLKYRIYSGSSLNQTWCEGSADGQQNGTWIPE